MAFVPARLTGRRPPHSSKLLIDPTVPKSDLCSVMVGHVPSRVMKISGTAPLTRGRRSKRPEFGTNHGESRLISMWQLEARHQLKARRSPSSGWGYRSASAPSVEPTVMACLAMMVSGDEETSPRASVPIRESARWLTSVQRPDGSLPVTEGLDASGGWPTAHALLLWSAVPGFQAPAERARTWLLARKGEAIPIDANAKKVVGHNSRLVGWPWIEATHSWLEPTAMAILALCRVGLAGHPRVKAGVELILDRALASGGWNYGNKAVFGTELRPQPGPTGLALLALAAGGVSARAPAIERGLTYLRRAIGDLRAPVSLGWATLGLRAHQAVAGEMDTPLAQACRRCIDKPDAVMGLALVLLASSEAGLGLMVNLSATGSPGPPAGRIRHQNDLKDRT
jgi:hypothetical protein